MKTLVIITVAAFVLLAALVLRVKKGLEKMFDELENEEPLDESDIFAVLHEYRNND